MHEFHETKKKSIYVALVHQNGRSILINYKIKTDCRCERNFISNGEKKYLHYLYKYWNPIFTLVHTHMCSQNSNDIMRLALTISTE